MKKCAVVIGVNKTGDLPMLNGAASGAKDFATWATGQGIDVTLLTDADGVEVHISQVTEAVRKYVKEQTFDQIIIFFSGHGILRGPDYELWLLSGASDDANDAVNISGSIWLARNARIPHVVFISDACRSTPNTPRLNQVQGSVIFPSNRPIVPRPVVDVFYAALPGDPALEVPAVYAAQNYRGIFTECLLEGLRGDVSEVLEEHPFEPKFVVPSWPLKNYLEKVVPERAAAVHIKFNQHPDIRAESRLPDYLSELPSHDEPGLSTNIEGERTSILMNFGGVGYGDGELDIAIEETEPPQMEAAIERLIHAKGRASFETHTGFTVIGSKIERVATNANHDIFEENGAFQVRIHQAEVVKNKSALLQIDGGIGVPVAVLPGFIGTVLVEGGQVVNVNYLPSRNTPRFLEYQYQAEEIEYRKAQVAAAARNGSFRIKDHEDAVRAADFLRRFKSFDPTLGLYAAYAYAQIGEFEEVLSVFTYMNRETEPVLFDVAWLAKASGQIHPNNSRMAPFCPLLTQGWSLIDPKENNLPLVVRRARKFLRPGLWTTFEPAGVKKLWRPLMQGRI